MAILLPLLAATADAHEVSHAVLDRRTCARIVVHVAEPDVIFRPGVDVRGRPVVPAEGSGGLRIETPTRIEFEWLNS